MNRFKLLKVGDELHLVRQQQPGVNDILKPDTLNRTNIRLDEELAESLGVEHSDIDGVSKDVQLVYTLNENQNVERQEIDFQFIGSGVNQPEPEVPISSRFSTERRYIVFDSIFYQFNNRSGNSRNPEPVIRATSKHTGQDFDFLRENYAIAAGNDRLIIITRHFDVLNAMRDIIINPAGQPPSAASSIEESAIIDTAGFEDVKLILGDGINADTDYYINMVVRSMDSLEDL